MYNLDDYEISESNFKTIDAINVDTIKLDKCCNKDFII